MNISDVDFSGFEGRKEALQKINRYHIYSTMFYRPSDYFHSVKVFNLVKAVIPRVVKVFGSGFDGDKAMIMALVHDDAEIITGDIQSGRKAKMTNEQLEKINENEIRAINELVVKYPKTISGYNYRELLLEVLEKDTLESQVVKYLDHVDALGEAYHEMYAGNNIFITHVADPDFGKIGLPYEYYITRFNAVAERYPLLVRLMSEELPFLNFYTAPDVATIVKNGKPHTLDSIKEDAGNSIYDWWKRVLISSLEPEELKNLYIQKENV